MGRDHVLVTSLGTTDYTKTRYVLEGKGGVETRVSPLALVEFLDIDRMFVARTPAAGETHDDDLRELLESAGVAPEFHDIPKISGRDDIDEILDLFDTEFDEDDDVTVSLDITHSYRSLVMVLFASLTYMDALGVIDIGGVYYGEYREEEGESPIIDITYLYTLIEWFYALRSYDQTGSLRPVAGLLDEEKRRLFRTGEQPHEFAELVSRVNGASRYLESGLPLEGGIAVTEALASIENIDDDELVGPEGAVLSPLEDALSPLGLREAVDDKSDIELDAGELEREAGIVRFYYEKGQYWLALECARELFINRVLYDSTDSDRENWLEKGKRRQIKQEKITTYVKQISDGTYEEEIPEPITVWMKLSNYRNYYAHSGFDAASGTPNVKKIERALETLCEEITNDSYWTELR